MMECNKENMIQQAYRFAKEIRLKALDMAIEAGRAGAHIGGSFSSIEIIAVLYGCVLHYDINNPHNPNRDRFIPSKTHCILAHFPA